MSENYTNIFNADTLMELVDKIEDNLQLSPNVIRSDLSHALFKEIKKIKNIGKFYSDDQLFAEVNHFLLSMSITRPENKIEVKKKLDHFISFLFKEKKYEATIIFLSLIGLPIGTQIGEIEIIDQEIKDIKFIEYINFLKNTKRIYIESRSVGKLVFSSHFCANVTDYIIEKLELPFAILSLIMDETVDVRDCLGIIRSSNDQEVFYIEPKRETHWFNLYKARYHSEFLAKLSDISINKTPNKLQTKILQSLRTYGLSCLSHRPEIRFLFLVASIECLLLSSSDKDYLGKKLAEKTAFLLKDDFKERLLLYKQMKNFYGKRSNLIHDGKSDISDFDVQTINDIYKELVITVLEFSITYPKMDQKSKDNDQEGLEDYLNKLKFS